MRYHWHWDRPYLGHTQHATTWIERAPSPDPDASVVVNAVHVGEIGCVTANLIIEIQIYH